MKGGPWLLLFYAATGGARPFPAAAGGPRAPAMRVQPRVRRGMTAMDIGFNKAIEGFTAISPLFMAAAVVASPYIVSINKLEGKVDNITTDMVRLEGNVNQINVGFKELKVGFKELIEEQRTFIVEQRMRDDKRDELQRMRDDKRDELQRMRDDKRDELQRTRDDKRDEILFQVLAQSQRAPQP